MARQKAVIKKGLRSKMFRLCIALVLAAYIVFGVIGLFQLRGMVNLASDMTEEQSSAIKEISQESILRLTRESMINTVELSAKNFDNKAKTMKHDFILLADEVQDVFAHPERYGEREVSLPDMANAGKLSLQISFGDPAAAEDEEGMRMLRKLANLEPTMTEIVRGTENYTDECYIALPNTATICVDAKSQHKIDENGQVWTFDPTVRPWYKAAVEKGEFCFTLAVHSLLLSIPEFQYGVPVYVDGELKAVLQGATRLSDIQLSMTDIGVGEKGFTILVSENGNMIYSPRETGELAMAEDLSMRIQDSKNERLIALFEGAKKGIHGFDEMDIDGEGYYAACATMPTVGWIQFTFVPRAETESHTMELLDEMDAIGTQAWEKFKENSKKSSLVILLMVLILIANAILAALALSGKILNPINKMTGEIKNMHEEDFVFQMEDTYRTGDEIEVLASTFGKLSDRMQEYLKNIMSMTAEKERRGTELSIATKIQGDMLPDASEAFTERPEFDLFASMHPAKEVGGDFYDFFMIDDDHLCLVIADVSDKGVPAALFMMSSMIIINNRAKQGGTPGEILTDANAQIWKNNDTKMFVTVWLGILDLNTGDMVCTNAGHEYPIIRGKDGVFNVFKDKHGVIVGALGKSKYKDYELHLDPGGTILVYTDGVPEANNAEGEFYGMERLEKTLNKTKAVHPKDILEAVKEDVDAFAAGAKQFDDLTMLCVTFHGRNTGNEGTEGV